MSISQSSANTVGGTEQKKKTGAEEKEENKKWAIPVDVSSPCGDFYKRIPNPAFKVSTLNQLEFNWKILLFCLL